MAFWDNLFKKSKKAEQPGNKDGPADAYQLNWIEPNANPWQIRLLDLRPISQHMISSSKDPIMAKNAISYNGEDGLIFLTQQVKSGKSIDTLLTFPVDNKLEDGVLFIPSTMEHKWAVYFHDSKLLFVRSWLRQVLVIAETVTKNNSLIVTRIHGEFTSDESKQLTECILKFIIHSHVLKEIVPAPIPVHLQDNTDQAGLWAFSAYGSLAHLGYFGHSVAYEAKSVMRSHSLLHIAVARGDMFAIENELNKGANPNALAADGLSVLHWALVPESEIIEYLLTNGADPNVQSVEGATPIMNAVQSNKMDHVRVLIQYKAALNKRDKRGFTALHRASEMGHTDIVRVLLEYGADKHIVAEGHTALSLAKMQKNIPIIEMLEVP